MEKGIFEGINFYSTITCAKFGELNMELYNKCKEFVEKCLSNAVSSGHLCMLYVKFKLLRVPVHLNNS